MLGLLYLWRDRIEVAAVAAAEGTAEEEFDTPGREKWVTMQARLRTGGSRPIGDAYKGVVEAVISFYEHVEAVRDIRKAGGGSLSEAVAAMKEAGADVRSKMVALEQIIARRAHLLGVHDRPRGTHCGTPENP